MQSKWHLPSLFMVTQYALTAWPLWRVTPGVILKPIEELPKCSQSGTCHHCSWWPNMPSLQGHFEEWHQVSFWHQLRSCLNAVKVAPAITIHGDPICLHCMPTLKSDTRCHSDTNRGAPNRSQSGTCHHCSWSPICRHIWPLWRVMAGIILNNSWIGAAFQLRLKWQTFLC